MMRTFSALILILLLLAAACQSGASHPKTSWPGIGSPKKAGRVSRVMRYRCSSHIQRRVSVETTAADILPDEGGTVRGASASSCCEPCGQSRSAQGSSKST